MRDPGMQYLDRLEKTAAKYASVRGEWMARSGEVRRLEKELQQAKEAQANATYAVNDIRSVMDRLLDAEAVTQFGLPETIKREEFESKIRTID